MPNLETDESESDLLGGETQTESENLLAGLDTQVDNAAAEHAKGGAG